MPHFNINKMTWIELFQRMLNVSVIGLFITDFGRSVSRTEIMTYFTVTSISLDEDLALTLWVVYTEKIPYRLWVIIGLYCLTRDYWLLINDLSIHKRLVTGGMAIHLRNTFWLIPYSANIILLFFIYI